MKDKSARYERTIEETKQDYRYHVICECNPERPVAVYHRMNKNTLAKFKRHAYRCNHCKNNNLIVLDTKTGEILAGEPVEGV